MTIFLAFCIGIGLVALVVLALWLLECWQAQRQGDASCLQEIASSADAREQQTIQTVNVLLPTVPFADRPLSHCCSGCQFAVLVSHIDRMIYRADGYSVMSCRRYPPTNQVYPPIYPDDWCGEFMPRALPPADSSAAAVETADSTSSSPSR